MRRTLIAVLVLFVALHSVLTVGLAQDATPEIAMNQGIIFGEVDGESLKLDIISPPAQEDSRPAVVIFPSWGSTRISELQTALELAKNGFVAVSADYRLSWPEHIDDAQLAVRWIRANAESYGIDPERICAVGASAGGHLAALLGVRDTRNLEGAELADESSRVTCAIAISGTSDLSIPDPSPIETAWMASKLGGTIEEAPDAYRDLSPVAFVDEQSAPFLIIHGNPDGIIPVEHARRLLAALQAAGIEVMYHEIPGASHFSGVDWETNGDLVLAFLKRHLQPER